LQEYDKCLQSGDAVGLDLVLSIGTGEPAETLRNYDTGGPGASWSTRSRLLRDVTVLLAEQAVGFDQSSCDFAEDRCRAAGIPFFRLNPVGVRCRIDQVCLLEGKLHNFRT
jgi:hypothetical protein